MKESVKTRDMGFGHVDIQVGLCICLNVFMMNHCMCT